MVVLDKCRKEDDTGEREYNYEFIEDFPDLYMDDERPKFHSGTQIEYSCTRASYHSSYYCINKSGTFVNRETTNETRSHRPLSQSVSQSRTATTDATDHHEPTAQPCGNYPWGPKKYYYWNHPLQLMVCTDEVKILIHYHSLLIPGISQVFRLSPFKLIFLLHNTIIHKKNVVKDFCLTVTQNLYMKIAY